MPLLTIATKAPPGIDSIAASKAARLSIIIIPDEYLPGGYTR